MFQDEDMVKYGMEKWTSGTGQNMWVHSLENCKGDHCPIHNPSDHHMKDWPTHWRGDRGIMERICQCGTGHPDPDDMNIVNGKDGGIHGCCGCCDPEDVKMANLSKTVGVLGKDVPPDTPNMDRDIFEEVLDANMMNGNPEMIFDEGKNKTGTDV